MNTLFMQLRCLMVQRTDRANLLTESGLIGAGGPLLVRAQHNRRLAADGRRLFDTVYDTAQQSP
ncbi:hypothetical protein [Ectothiorhodospira magna]|uniref:hypothetical protein n=1 Tax=Ectothiorhodospira magna TaxID=867345 RepID=UPI0013900A7F|nr:hypothetical protein [Ectothiorhodospira magna]